MPRQTPLTPARLAVLEWALTGLRAGQPEMLCAPFVVDLANQAAPGRRVPFHDMPGRALCSLRDWLNGPFRYPMEATVREICLALDEPDPGDPFGTWLPESGYGRRMVAGGAP